MRLAVDTPRACMSAAMIAAKADVRDRAPGSRKGPTCVRVVGEWLETDAGEKILAHQQHAEGSLGEGRPLPSR
jgi:hypothetical protein